MAGEDWFHGPISRRDAEELLVKVMMMLVMMMILMMTMAMMLKSCL